MKLKTVFIALFAALICTGCFISVPLPGLVPLTVQNMFAIIAGNILGGISGAVAVLIFLVLGALGLPVFSGVKGGFAIIAGPTGGFLFGYLLGALITGIILGRPTINQNINKKNNLKTCIKITLATIAGYLIIYIPGILWFLHFMQAKGNSKTLTQALSACLIPFIPGDLIKIVITIILSLTIRPVLARYLDNANNDN